MDKVLVERPRWAHTLGYHAHRHTGAPRDLEDSPRVESMRARGRDKHLNENLSPLIQFLLKSVGRPWDEVYSEICKGLSVRNAVQKHVRDHLDDFVERNPLMLDGAPHEPSAAGSERSLHRPIRSYRGRLNFFVHPETGLLERAPYEPTAGAPAKPDPDRVMVDRSLEYRRIEGHWYEVQFEPLGELGNRRTVYDVLLRATLRHDQTYSWWVLIESRYGKPLRYAAHKRALSAREVTRLEAMRSRRVVRPART